MKLFRSFRSHLLYKPITKGSFLSSLFQIFSQLLLIQDWFRNLYTNTHSRNLEIQMSTASTAKRQNITGRCEQEFTLETEKLKKPPTQQLRMFI